MEYNNLKNYIGENISLEIETIDLLYFLGN